MQYIGAVVYCTMVMNYCDVVDSDCDGMYELLWYSLQWLWCNIETIVM